MKNTYDCDKLATKIQEEMQWIANDHTSLEIILALSILIGRYGNHSNAALIGKEIVETIRAEEFEKAKNDFDSRLKKAMEIQ